MSRSPQKNPLVLPPRDAVITHQPLPEVSRMSQPPTVQSYGPHALVSFSSLPLAYSPGIAPIHLNSAEVFAFGEIQAKITGSGSDPRKQTP